MSLESAFRIASALVLFSAMGISVYFRRKADKEAGETISRKVDGIFLMVIIKLGGLILWISPLVFLIHPAWMDWAKIGLPVWIRWIAIVIGFVDVVLIYWMFSSIGLGISPTSATRNHHHLVTNGPYRWIRHPLYTFGSAIFISFGLIADNWFLILIGILAFILMAIRTPKEEANLVEKFGDEYRNYMKRTGRFFPRIRT